MERPRYSTLSHAWGSKSFLTLTSENYPSFLAGIPFEDLTQTFQDAIKITRRLGLEFIWIDSLCIVQGNEKDWENESSLMRSVYGGSTINLAAASAVDGSQGCFLRPPYFSGGFRSRVIINGHPAVRSFHSGRIHDESTTLSHLGTRAWCLQERLLSSRTIHLGCRGAFWECQTTIASEFLPQGYSHFQGDSLVCRHGISLKRLWRNIIHEYSRANLSFGKGKSTLTFSGTLYLFLSITRPSEQPRRFIPRQELPKS